LRRVCSQIHLVQQLSIDLVSLLIGALKLRTQNADQRSCSHSARPGC
jgi:hypothetical protein